MKTVNRTDRVEEISIYDIKDFSIGHEEDKEAITGCSVIICNNRENLVAGSDVRGGAPGTRTLDIYKPMNGFPACHAVVLSGGSLFGLNAAGGAEKYLEERGIGEPFVMVTLPVVSQAIIFDLAIGSCDVRPDEAMAYRACENAYKGIKYEDGNVGVGIGATVGKLSAPDMIMKSGLGTCCYKKGDLYVGAIMGVNAVGNVVDPKTSETIAGMMGKDGKFIDAEQFALDNLTTEDFDSGNTTIGVVITNAKLTNPQAHKIAAWSHDGIARAIRPVHSMSDGDTMFAMATGEVEACMNLVGVMAVQAVEQAIVNAVKGAESLGGYKSRKEFLGL